MSGRVHQYHTRVVWTGNLGSGTSSYRAYSRNHEVSAEGKPLLAASSDPAFRGDRSRYNPEELLLAALSSCHMLSYLHLCADRDVNVLEYEDDAVGQMQQRPDGSGAFTEAVLRPRMKVSAESDVEVARELHQEAHRLCFIANSVNFPVRFEAEVVRD